jgi:hypothetical protein
VDDATDESTEPETALLLGGGVMLHFSVGADISSWKKWHQGDTLTVGVRSESRAGSLSMVNNARDKNASDDTSLRDAGGRRERRRRRRRGEWKRYIEQTLSVVGTLGLLATPMAVA